MASKLIEDRCKGSLVGALIGDAAGAPVEFHKKITERVVDSGLKMEGGGKWKVIPGQITDDGEMSLCVLQGIVNGEGEYNYDLICHEYLKWIETDPFSAGYATQNALKPCVGKTSNQSKEVRESAKRYNIFSQSNGSLMKLGPTAVYCSFLNDVDSLIDIVTTETQHLHPHQKVIDCNIAFTLAVRDLIQGKSSHDAYTSMRDFAINSSIKDWLEELEAHNFQQVTGHKQIGWVKIAFQQAFLHLAKESSIEFAFKDIIFKGGDTDTNAAIAGMLLGARDGYSNLPGHMIRKVMECGSAGDFPRPEFLHPGKVFYPNFAKLMKICRYLK